LGALVLLSVFLSGMHFATKLMIHYIPVVYFYVDFSSHILQAGSQQLLSAVPMPSSVPIPSKVSSITTNNANEGVSIRSDEVTVKSSTDGSATSAAGKSSNLSLDALAKAKKALQLKKELSEKLKKLPMVRKHS
jgi:hypothetical protein